MKKWLLKFKWSLLVALAVLIAGTMVTLTEIENFTNKTLDASVVRGIWTASGTWTTAL